VYKIATSCCTISKLHYASYLFMCNCGSQLHKHKQFHITYLLSWH